MPELPIDPLLPEICRTLSAAGSLVLEAPPGAGKSTRVAPALLDAGLTRRGEILVSEPRRLAARLLAHHVARERSERVGQSIGYSVRFEDATSRDTKIRYVTEGVLLRRLLDDPTLDGVAGVILDEFHERSLATDLALALLAGVKRSRRPDLALLVMSATLDAVPVAEFLDGCPRLVSQGRSFPVSIEHLARPDERPLEKRVASAVRDALARDPDGDVLVFLPGAGEIRRARDALASWADEQRILLLPLHGDMPIDEQARAVEPAERRKVVLSTNVAETSLTIDGVTTVIDSGLARAARHSPWSGLPRLETVKVSRSSAAQRAGRAGRTRPGRVVRLYTKGDHDTRPEHDAPEICRLDLSEALLVLHGAGIAGVAELDWLTPPPKSAASAAEELLRALGALDDEVRLTPTGRRMLAFPLHPRLARLVVEGERRGIADRATLSAALLAERDIRLTARAGFAERTVHHGARGDSDVSELIDLFEEAKDARFDAGRLRLLGLDARSTRAVDRAHRQLARIARDDATPPASLEEEERRLRLALLTAFPDRVARRARAQSSELSLSAGGGARLSEASVVHDPMFMVAVDIEERGTGKSSAATVRIASAIDPDWLLELYLDSIDERDEVVFNPASKRVESVSRLSYGSVLIEETRRAAPASPAASRVLASAALENKGMLAAASGLETLLARVALVRRMVPEAELPDLGDDPVSRAIELACEGLTSFAELSEARLGDGLLSALGARQARALRESAPERLDLPGGRNLVVHYEPERPPWVESRLQDFFGSNRGPTICMGRLPLTLHLLAPNGRAVQVTTDLEGFWQRHYPSIRRELMRRYPKHAWPEDGANAKPPERRKR